MKAFKFLFLDNLDFCILKLERTVQLSSKVGFVCLPGRAPLDYSRVELAISGWGRTSDTGPQSNVLNVATVYGVSNVDCKAKYLIIGESTN